MAAATKVTLAAVAVLTSAVVASYLWFRPQAPAGSANALARVLANPDNAGFALALAPRVFEFPRDHGPHPEFKTEWWYFTGNLASASGRRFGYQLTFFRSGLHRSGIDLSRSAWATDQAYMAHFALSDAAGGRFRHWERFSRGAAGLAGASAAPLRVWLDDWSVQQSAPGGPLGRLTLQLRAREAGVEIALELGSDKPAVLQGDRGLSRKGATPGQASYYYSLTRMPTRGSVRVDSVTHAVEGTSWLDREWSTSSLEPDQQGWDWFALHLNDGRELMFYHLRRKDGGIDPFSAGVMVDSDGRATRLAPEDVELVVERHWRSTVTGVRYPGGWRLQVPSVALDLTLTPLLPNQEWDAAFRYWEGAVVVSGREPSAATLGYGYVELVGYE